MASLTWDGESARVQFIAADGKRKAVRLGPVSERIADRVKAHIETIADCQRFALPIDTGTAAWLADIGDDFHARLAAVGLVQPRRRATLKQFLAEYIAGRADIAANTRRNMNTVRKRLEHHFGDVQMDAVTADLATAFASALSRPGFSRPHAPPLAKATIGRDVKMARQFFAAALEQRLVDANPFADVPIYPQVNPDRNHFIDRETIGRVMAATDNPRWHALIALSRYGGLRCPSEVVNLRWADVDFKRKRFVVRTHKTVCRTVPLFPELRDVLEPMDRAGELIVAGTPNGFHNRFTRLIERAGVEPWPRLFHNMRASRETELAAEYPLHVCAAWLGNSAMIAHKHYVTVREEDFRRAVG